MQFDKTKLRAVVLYTCAHCGPADLGAVKLHKVLYFTDMLHHVRVGTSVTGATYRKRPFGPTCDQLLPLLRALSAAGAIEIRESEQFGFRKKEYVAKEVPQIERLSGQELSLLDDMIEFVCYENTAKTISEFSHNRAWKEAELGDVLPYDSAFLWFPHEVPLETEVIKRSRAIVKLPDKRLWLKSKPVGKTDDVRRLVDDMFETMYEAPGIGLAAIQVGIAKRVITMDLAKKDEPKNPQVFINPEILWMSEERAIYEEGCLSIPEYYEEVERPAQVKVAYLDRDGAMQEIDANGLFATCLQHEIDHLNGVLFIDHISKLKRARVIRKFAKAAKRAEADA
jgi:peptide deformylase